MWIDIKIYVRKGIALGFRLALVGLILAGLLVIVGATVGTGTPMIDGPSQDLASGVSDETQIAEGLVNQWMNSPGHRENILRPYWQAEGIGIYVKDTDEKTKVYATQNFC